MSNSFALNERGGKSSKGKDGGQALFAEQCLSPIFFLVELLPPLSFKAKAIAILSFWFVGLTKEDTVQRGYISQRLKLQLTNMMAQ